MDVEMMLYSKLDKYGNELSSITKEEFKTDVREIYEEIRRIAGLDHVKRMIIGFLPASKFSKDDFADAILQLIRTLEGSERTMA